MIFDGGVAGSGFEHTPGGAQHANTSAFSYHYYCNSFVPSYDEKPLLTKIVCDSIMKQLVWRAVEEETARLGGAALMTEGMACNFDRAEGRDECWAVMADLDRHLLSWTDYGVSQGARWLPSANQSEGWARTYARAIAGKPLNMSFEPDTKDFAFCYIIDASIREPTEIFASRTYSYQDGVQVSTTPNLNATFPDGSDEVMLTPVTKEGGIGCVWISRIS